MSVDKLVDSAQLDADLTSVANAIRTKGGTSASLAFPADFVSAINAISGGGGMTAFSKIADFTVEEETSAVTINLDSDAQDKLSEANEIVFVDYLVPTADSTKTSKGWIQHELCKGNNYTVYLRPEYQAGSTVPAYNQSNSLPRIVYACEIPVVWDTNRPNQRPWVTFRGFTNSNNVSITSGQSWGMAESNINNLPADRLRVTTNTAFGVNSYFALYVR